MEHANPAQFLASQAPRPAAPPDFDPDHPDAEILEAFENVRAYRIWGYGLDDAGLDRPEDQAGSDWDAEYNHERGVTGNWATTPAGVSARLALIVATLDAERWIDRGVMEQGISALDKARKAMDFPGAQIAQAAFELIHIEWESALAAYERGAAGTARAQTLKALVDMELLSLDNVGLGASDMLAELKVHVHEYAAATSGQAHLMRLLRTLTPDIAAYRRKVEIALKEGMENEVGPWLARDANFILGVIERPAPAAPAEKAA